MNERNRMWLEGGRVGNALTPVGRERTIPSRSQDANQSPDLPAQGLNFSRSLTKAGLACCAEDFRKSLVL